MSSENEIFTDDEDEFQVESIIRLSPVMFRGEYELDNSILTFRGHTGSVYALDFRNTLVASGGGDDLAYFWDIRNGETLFQCTGHQDSVVAIGFNHDSSLIATGDLAGFVQIWNNFSFDLECSYETGDDLQWMLWHYNSNIIIRGGLSGNIYLNLVSTHNSKIFVGYGASCTAGKVLDDGIHLISGYYDGLTRVWNMRDESFKNIQEVSGSISCIDYRENVALVGSTSGDIMLFNHQSAEVYRLMQLVYSYALEDITPACVETVGFSRSIPVYFAGGSNNMLHLYDAATHELRHALRHPGCVLKAQWVGNNVISSCTDGVLRMWDGLSGRQVRSFHGHHQEIYDFSVDENEHLIVSCDLSAICKVFSFR
ncbi:Angio-associated migratory cell protein [Trichinella pseudospiralis]|uniref:Angio-associated migratory cell protein n=1 Tax=Trichinella pseudospiralis TaxID=6337 RepID=A0A0V1IY15_TRIPS|nr:Angio-associated migratory cell protein [Trichinella pseudospiralis]KRZ27595.1 Angio-associated migratory cell protein [Trichinella pseudospiralis]